MSIVGKRVPMTKKQDAYEKATGIAEYTSTIKMPGMLRARILRSPYPHAVVLKVDVRKAEKMRGVSAVLSSQDVSVQPYGAYPPPSPQDVYTLPPIGGKVRYVGDPVAAVAAKSLDVAEEALELIDVTYEELPAVLDPEEAMKPDAPRIHAGGNLASDPLDISFGDIERGFEEADEIFDNTYRTPIQCHVCSEPHSSVASWDADGRLTVLAGTQAPFATRDCLAFTLGISPDKVRVVVPPAGYGGGFGSKKMVQSLSLDIAALLAKKAKRPVKLVFTREEEFACTETRHPAIVHLRTGVKKDGSLTARYSRTIYDTGAYANHGPFVFSRALRSLALWRCDNMRYLGFLVYTNKPVAGAMRGYGNPQHTFAVELQNDEIAESLGIDPMEWRFKNHIQIGDENKAPGRRIPGAPTGRDWIPALYKIESCGLSECIKKGAERIGWKEKRRRSAKLTSPRNRGVGMACGMHTSGTMPTPRVSSAYVSIDQHGKVNVSSGGCDHGGTGQHTAIAQIVAQELSVPLEDVTVTAEDTDSAPYDSGTAGASGGTYTVGGAVLDAVADLKRKLLRQASFMLKAEVKDLEIRDAGVFVRESSDEGLSFQEIAERARLDRHPHTTLEGDGYYYYPPTNAPPFFADFVEVEVDMETGQVKVLKVVAAHDSGKAINPMFFEGQVHGGIQQGLGYALTEELVVDQKTGKPLNPSLLDYNVLRVVDMPKIDVVIVETMEPTGPLGAKGLGEPCSVAVAPAVANAVYDAIGVRIRELPITQERILKALKERNRSSTH